MDTELKDVTNWHSLGVHLRVPKRMLTDIATRYQYSQGLDRCKEEVLDAWLRRTSTASWKELVDALNQIDEEALASQLKDKYCQPSSTQNGTMKIAVLLMCAMTAIVVATIEADIPLTPGIYFFGNSHVYCIYPNGEYKIVSTGNWSGMHAAGFFKRRLFGIHMGTMYEVFEKSWKTIASGYEEAKFIVQNDDHMYTVLQSRLYRITFTDGKATEQIVVHLHINPLTMVSTYGYLFCATGKWMVIDPVTGYSEILSHNGRTLAQFPTAAVAYYGWIYSINHLGNIDLVNSEDGNKVWAFRYNGLFKGSRGIVEYKDMLYAIGRDGRFYEIDPYSGRATAKGKRSDWQVDGVMAAASW